MEEELRVPRNVMRVVSVETRTDILKALERRQMTASELSRYLDKHVTTVVEHLEMLRSTGLVERVERPGRKWVYYKLTKYGKQILHPQPYKVVLVLVLSLFMLSFGLIDFSMHANLGSVSDRLATTYKQAAESQNQTEQPIEIPLKGPDLRPYESIGLIILAVAGITYAVYKLWKRY